MTDKAEQVVRAMQKRRAFRGVNGFFGTADDPYYLLHEDGKNWFIFINGNPAGSRASSDFAGSLKDMLAMVAAGIWVEIDPPEE